MEILNVTCPACGKKVEAIVRDSRIKGYCAIAKKYVDFTIETNPERKNYRQNPEYRAKLREATKKMWQDPEYRAKQKAALKNKGAGTKSFLKPRTTAT